METGVSYSKLDPDTDERFLSLRRELGVTTFGINQILLRPGQRGRIHRHTTRKRSTSCSRARSRSAWRARRASSRRARSSAWRPKSGANSSTAADEDCLLLALGGAVEHVGRDGEAYRVAGTPRPAPRRSRSRCRSDL